MRCKKEIILGIGLLSISLSLQAQELPASNQNTILGPPGKWHLQDLYLQYGALYNNGSQGYYDDFSKLAPNSEIIKQGVIGYEAIDSGFESAMGTVSVLIGYGIKPNQDTGQQTRHQFRTGLTFINGGGISANFNRSEITGQAILTTQDSTIIQLLSMNEHYVAMRYRARQFRLDQSYLLRTNPDARFSFFTGIGVTAGLSVTAATEISSSMYSGVTYFVNNDPTPIHSYPHPIGRDRKQEFHRNKTSYGYSAYLPIGFNIRLGKINPFMSRLNLFLEARPVLNFLTIPQLGTYRTIQLCNSIGLRIRL